MMSFLENELLEVQKLDPNNTEYNYNNIAYENPAFASHNIIYTNPILSIKKDEMDGMEEYQAYSEIIKENIDYDALLQRYPYETEVVEGIFDLILETVISKKASMVVSGQEYPAAFVKSKFLKLNYSHTECVIEHINHLMYFATSLVIVYATNMLFIQRVTNGKTEFIIFQFIWCRFYKGISCKFTCANFAQGIDNRGIR